jgi:hypothetical protein
VGPVVWSVLRPEVGGYIYGGARSADISDAATTPPAGTPRPTPTHPITRSSGVSNQASPGSGTTRPTSTWMGRASRHLSITPSTNPFPGRPETSPPIGSRFWPARDETGGDHQVGDAGAPQRQLSGLIDPASSSPSDVDPKLSSSQSGTVAIEISGWVEEKEGPSHGR